MTTAMMSILHELAAYWNMLTSSPQVGSCLLIVAIILPLVILACRTLHRLNSPAAAMAMATAVIRSPRQLWRDQQGTATIEFTMVFPILLFLIMLLTQSALLMGARLVVNHAAFVAARSAVVIIPTNESARQEPYNTVEGFSDSYKTSRIREAAVYALLPVAGKMDQTMSDDIDATLLVQGLESYYEAYDRPAPGWIGNYMPSRLRYADRNTQVTILRTRVVNNVLELDPIVGSHTFGPRDPITVQVTHRMNLAVPYVSAIFANGRNPASQGGGYYTNITSQCTLPNEGIVNALPPTPDRERIP